MNLNFEISYKCDGKTYTSNELETKHYSAAFGYTGGDIKLKVTPKTKLEFLNLQLKTDYDFAADDRFFVNGYQAWTTTREVSKDDLYTGLTKLTKLTKTGRYMAAISGDYMFTDYPEKQGLFHSFTYTYVRNGEKVFLIGSLSERNGYTIFDADMRAGKLCIRKDLEGLITAEAFNAFDIVCINGTYEDVFDRYFERTGVKKPRIGHLSGYTSWYNYFQKIDEDIILRDLNGLDRAKDSVSVFQIDDGYEPFVGDWLECDNKKFPNGMKYIAEKIHEKGYLAGLWLAPFNVQKKSAAAKEHPEWLLKNSAGKPELGCFAWGGAYTLDIYNPAVRAHLKKVFDTVLNTWGYDMVKLDFLYSQCIQPRAGKTRGTIMCEAMDFLRELVGEKILLGCGVPLGPCFGVVDACRISCDVDLKYTGKFYNALHINNELPSAQNAITNSIFRRHLNGRAFINDPDVFFLRSSNLTFTREQKLLLAKINHLCGNVLFVSDYAGDYSEEDINILKSMFAKSTAKIISAQFVSENTVEIVYGEDNTKKLRFNIKTGDTNYS